MSYNFLILSLLLLVPSLIVFYLRKDLRVAIYKMSLISIPFAFTERFFFPDYWEPNFLFGLIHKIGFGIEDIIFVIGLAACSTTAYPFVFRKTYIEIDKNGTKSKNYLSFGKITILAILIMLALSLALKWQIPIIYATLVIMGFASLGIIVIRKDLVLPAIHGAWISVIVYSVICILIEWLYPKIFLLVWHTEKFLNIFIFGIPLEEILYASLAGMTATIFYPFLFSLKFKKL